MPVSRSMRRLLRIRDIQEEQCRLALESALGELNRLEQALVATFEQGRQGRRLVNASVRSGVLLDRLAGLEETHAADRLTAALVPRIAEAASDVVALRQAFLGKRVERRQAEILIEKTEAQDAVNTGRREQQTIDGWYSSRMCQAGAQADSTTPVLNSPDDECAASGT